MYSSATSVHGNIDLQTFSSVCAVRPKADDPTKLGATISLQVMRGKFCVAVYPVFDVQEDRRSRWALWVVDAVEKEVDRGNYLFLRGICCCGMLV